MTQTRKFLQNALRDVLAYVADGAVPSGGEIVPVKSFKEAKAIKRRKLQAVIAHVTAAGRANHGSLPATYKARIATWHRVIRALDAVKSAAAAERLCR